MVELRTSLWRYLWLDCFGIIDIGMKEILERIVTSLGIDSEAGMHSSGRVDLSNSYDFEMGKNWLTYGFPLDDD
jgi:hypothetical protein